jgi:hypothetical protein
MGMEGDKMNFKKDDKVTYKVTTVAVIAEWEGVVLKTNFKKRTAYVLFDGGGDWISFEYLTLKGS